MQIDPNEAESLDLGPGKASRAFQSMKNAQASTCSLTGRPYQNCQACRQLWRQQRAAAAVQNVLGLKAADSACVVQESYLDEESIRHYRQHKQQEEEEQRHRQQEQAAAGAVSDEVSACAVCMDVPGGPILWHLPSVCMHSDDSISTSTTGPGTCIPCVAQDAAYKAPESGTVRETGYPYDRERSGGASSEEEISEYGEQLGPTCSVLPVRADCRQTGGSGLADGASGCSSQQTPSFAYVRLPDPSPVLHYHACSRPRVWRPATLSTSRCVKSPAPQRLSVRAAEKKQREAALGRVRWCLPLLSLHPKAQCLLCLQLENSCSKRLGLCALCCSACALVTVVGFQHEQH